MSTNNNSSYRPSVIIVNGSDAVLLEKNHGLLTIAAKPVLGNGRERMISEVVKELGRTEIEKLFVTNSDYSTGKLIVLTMNKAREGWQDGNNRLGDARRLARGVATFVVSAEEIKAKRLKKGQILSVAYDGDAPRKPFDTDNKPFVYYTVEQRDNKTVSVKWEKGVKLDKGEKAPVCRDQWALEAEIEGVTHKLDKHVMADLLAKGFTFAITGEFKHVLIQHVALNLSILRGDHTAFYALKTEIGDRQKANALKQAVARGDTILDF